MYKQYVENYIQSNYVLLQQRLSEYAAENSKVNNNEKPIPPIEKIITIDSKKVAPDYREYKYDDFYTKYK
jgi:hypothetical protein